MARLINADAMRQDWLENGENEFVYDTNAVLDSIDAQPTVDAVPVVHGIWLVDDYDIGDPGYYSAFIEVHCSKCGYGLGAESGQYGWYYGDPFPLNYCPNCGAKMDLEVEEL